MNHNSPRLSYGEVSSDGGVKVHDRVPDSMRSSVNAETRRGTLSRNSRPGPNEHGSMPDMTTYNPYRQHDFRSRSPYRPRGRSPSPYRARGRSPSPYRARVRSPSPYRARNRSRSPYRAKRPRSRSPYRPSQEHPKEKRRRKDNHKKDASDPRSHKTAYEDKPRGHPGNYKDLDRPKSSYTNTYSDPQHSSRFGEPSRNGDRDRVRSPYYKAQENTTNGAARLSIKDSEPNQRESAPILPQQNDTKSKSSQSDQVIAEEPDESNDEPETSKTVPVLSEAEQAEIIEQRRKRREQIRAKHNTSLLVQVLEPTTQLNAQTPPTTPRTDEPSQLNSPASMVDSTGTPRDTPPPGTPDFGMSDAKDLIEPHQDDSANMDQGPSAADFNPEELNEDRLKYQPTSAGGSDNEDEQAPTAPEVDSKPTKEFDMFADDDDDEAMFAALDASAPKGQTLDQSIMDNWDLPDGHYRIIRGEILDRRYNVLEQIGKGTFATVVRAIDLESGSKVAIKIACNNDTMLKAGRREVRFLKQLNETDPEDKRHIIRLHRDFMHKQHLCLVFEGLSYDLRALLKKLGRRVGLRLTGLKSHAFQLFLALEHMRKEEILHADLKPDNILVNDNPYNLIKVCDFGTAIKQKDVLEPTPYLISRFYRPPEVIIGMPYDSAIDMWSIGCTLFELYTDRILFRGQTNNGMLRDIQLCFGKLPQRMLKKGQLSGEHFDMTDPAFPFYGEEVDQFTNRTVMKPVNFKQSNPGQNLKSRLAAGVEGGLKNLKDEGLREHNAFVDLLEKCLQIDPEKRIKPRDALHHPFFKQPTAPTGARGPRD